MCIRDSLCSSDDQGNEERQENGDYHQDHKDPARLIIEEKTDGKKIQVAAHMSLVEKRVKQKHNSKKSPEEQACKEQGRGFGIEKNIL